MWFGPGKGKAPVFRFDDPGSAYGVCYFGETHYAAFAETFLRTLPTRAVSSVQLKAKAMSQCALDQDVTLAAAFGPGLVKLGTTASVFAAKGAGSSYAHSQEWSRALFDHPDSVDGIAYHSSHDSVLLCAALFDRAKAAISVAETSSSLDGETALLADVAKRYQIALL